MRNGNSADFLGRFWARVKITGTCWLWTGAIDRDGYARVRTRNTSTTAHIVAYSLVTGEPWPGGMDGHHECPNRHCVRPHAGHVVPVEPDEHRGYIWGQRHKQENSHGNGRKQGRRQDVGNRDIRSATQE